MGLGQPALERQLGLEVRVVRVLEREVLVLEDAEAEPAAEAYDAANIFLDGIAEGIDTREDMLTFINEYDEHWIPKPDTDDPFRHYPTRTGRDLDQGVLYHVVGGAFCPGGEIGWIMRNPAAWRLPWRLKADPAFSQFTPTTG